MNWPPILLALLLSSEILLAKTPQLPKVMGPIPATGDSQIFGAEDFPGGPAAGDLKKNGYVEEEFLLTGTANVYQYDSNWNRTLKRADVPYTTRMIVRRPKDRRRFSGNVQFECGHPQLGNTINWYATRDYILRHGDAFVGVMCGADLITRKTPQNAFPTAPQDLLKWFDAKRYADISWPEDDGIRWDVMAQVGALVKGRHKSNPLGGYKVERMYAAGWSFTGSLWRVYVNEGFHEEYRMPDGSPIFDGYLMGISSSTFSGGYDPLNNNQNLPVGNPRRVTKSIDVPVIELMSENEAVTNTGPQAPESDYPKSRHRLYEVPGLSHGDGLGNGVSGMRVQLNQRGYPSPPASVADCAESSDVPMGHLAMAALANMDLWVRRNVPPPRAQRMNIDPQTKQGLKDVVGNTQGGVRSAQLDVPLAKYGDYEEKNPACRPSSAYGRLLIKRFLLSKEELRKIYRDQEDFLDKFSARIDQMVKERWLLPTEADKEIEAAKLRARAAFR